MPVETGKYDDNCVRVRDETNARTVILLVVKGDKGNGFSVVGDFEDLVTVLDILRNIANQIEADMKGGNA